MQILPNIKGPDDVKALAPEQLPILAEEIREEIIHVTSENGGHIGPNLGVVELTIALHRHFSTPKDRFVFDVSHQGYVHKLLTGRYGEKFRKIRSTGGLSGFLNREESEHDCYGAGHAGTALSAALGMATARDLNGTDEHVVALVGDAALTCGITMEALNNIRSSTKRLVVILNDNKWSIAPNVGAISNYLNELITNPVYNRLHQDFEEFLEGVPGGDRLKKFGSKVKQETKDFFSGDYESSLFEKYGLRYIGPIDGHDQKLLDQYMEFAKKSEDPVILHVLTTKGKGFEAALGDPEKFHGTSPFCKTSGKSKSGKPGPSNYQDVMGRALVDFCKKDKRIVGITGAMPSGTGLKYLRDELPEQYFDVGIAEEHAVLFAAGLATSGIKPVVTIYSTFLQRAYDCIIHDVSLQDLDVMFCMDRAGLSPNDGATHHGLFDISYLRCVPRAVIMQPKDEDELVDMMKTGLEHKGQSFIRYPRGASVGVQMKDDAEAIEIGKAEPLRDGDDIIIWALGPMVQDAFKLANKIGAEQGLHVGVVNARFAKPIDSKLLIENAKKARLIVTMEDHVVTGGFGTGCLEVLQENNVQTPVVRLGWPDRFVDHGSSGTELRAANGLSPQDMEKNILDAYRDAEPKAIAADTTPVLGYPSGK
ncbi:1-deoxy-D-xylulose-5-phosphate synthase [Rubellicoccus peritrichatus]|uniref:1-deoxy-D-xylulose-5-phosphate synthase n=1 Tax=Rubellicoccus peritrichatus TaxID=3080537 RepID=A0AAQ3QVQ2_9BACT|nr:1-deoxy-D-xylulose-5-phosphate synthase [Puniceicoccus sp. CR14]WOO41072.1 1-deoxy-D-xylulose-5-phosphate synthase [Puniceicoccus sp. CR14]